MSQTQDEISYLTLRLPLSHIEELKQYIVDRREIFSGRERYNSEQMRLIDREIASFVNVGIGPLDSHTPDNKDG